MFKTKKILGLLLVLLMLGTQSVYAQERTNSEDACAAILTQSHCEDEFDISICMWKNGACEDLEIIPGAGLAVDEIQNTLYKPTAKTIIQLSDETVSEEWNVSPLETYGIQFLVRGKEALTWSLNVEDGGFHTEAIEKSYMKVLTIVNSLFILGLLAIAIMYQFSILIPRRYLKKVILVYSLAVIFINFALPINQLFIDGTNLLQNTLLTNQQGDIEITDIVKTPAYEEIVSYKHEPSPFPEENLGEISSGERVISGTLRSASGSISRIELSVPEETLSMKSDSKFNAYGEQAMFRFVMIIATALAYFILALIFILRIIILWALLILSPLLLLLAIFKSTRGWFRNWLGLYGRWLFIGPITALGLALVVNIWQLSGLPIQVNPEYTAEVFSQAKVSNLFFYLPGSDQPNTLANTTEMMEYIIFLLMLYLPIFMGIMLTRQKVLREASVSIAKSLVKKTSNQSQMIQQTQITEKEMVSDRQGGFVRNIKDLVSKKIIEIAETALPLNKIKNEPEHPSQMMPTASNFLPENLKDTSIHKMMELMGQEKGSKASHERVIEKLAFQERIQGTKESNYISAVMGEINVRAEHEDPQAVLIMQEIQELKASDRTQESMNRSGKADRKEKDKKTLGDDESYRTNKKRKDKPQEKHED